MRIQHNITALNAHRNLSNNNSFVGKNLEKLSSGYKINRAGDDAAGLAISEKMRAQITGLETAQKNAEDGVALVQTAEGALTEVHSMLNRMVALATQSANGTYSSTNRNEMQKEIEQLNDEINRISQSANFNGMTLFSGSLVTNGGGITLHVGETSQTYNQLKISLTLMNTQVVDGMLQTVLKSTEGGTHGRNLVDSVVYDIDSLSCACCRCDTNVCNAAGSYVCSSHRGSCCTTDG